MRRMGALGPERKYGRADPRTVPGRDRYCELPAFAIGVQQCVKRRDLLAYE